MSAVCGFAGNYAYVSACFNLGMLACFGCYCMQLAYVYCVFISFTVCYACNTAILVYVYFTIDNGCITEQFYGCALAVSKFAYPAAHCTQGQCCITIADGFDIFQVFVQLNLNLSAVITDGNVLVTAEVNSFTGSYFRCFAAVSGQIPALVCIICYFTNFLQLFFGCSLTFAVSKAIISSSCIAKSAYGCSSAIHNNVACCYTAACPNRAMAAADVYISVVIISGKENVVTQSNIIFLATVFIGVFGYSNIITLGNSTVFECFFVYLLQLCHINSIGVFISSCYIGNLASDIVRRITHRNSSFGGSPSGFFCRRDVSRCKSSECSFFAASYSIRYRAYSDSYSALFAYRRTIPNSHRIICRNSIVISQRNHIFSTL